MTAFLFRRSVADRFKSHSYRWLLNFLLPVALIIWLPAAESEAKTLKYRFDYTVTKLTLNDSIYPYLGIREGQTSRARLFIELDEATAIRNIVFTSPGTQFTDYKYPTGGFDGNYEDERFYSDPIPLNSFRLMRVDSYDKASRRIDFRAADADLLDMILEPRNGTGNGVFGWEYDRFSVSWAQVEFDATNVSIVPLPASGMTIGVAMAISLGASRYFRRRS